VVDEDAEDAFEVAAVDDQEPVEAFGADGADEALGERVRLRRSHRRLDDLDSFAGEDGVEVAAELDVAVADQEAKRPWSLVERLGELTCLLRDPRSGSRYSRPGGRACSEIVSTVKKSTAPQDLRDGRRRNGDAEAVQLTGDPQVAPARVFPRQPNNQLTDLAADWRSADPTRIRPAVRDQTAVPAQQCRRRNEERPPTRPWQNRLATVRKTPPVVVSCGRRVCPRSTASSRRKYDDLELLEVLRARTQHAELEQAFGSGWARCVEREKPAVFPSRPAMPAEPGSSENRDREHAGPMKPTANNPDANQPAISLSAEAASAALGMCRWMSLESGFDQSERTQGFAELAVGLEFGGVRPVAFDLLDLG
jgi:hypothetical protein